MTETWGCWGLSDNAEWGSMVTLSGSRKQSNRREKDQEEKVKFQAEL
jgi:hypothetical protein